MHGFGGNHGNRIGMNIVPATYEMMSRYYARPPQYTAYAWAAMENDQMLGIGGVCLYQSKMLVFLGMNEELRERFRKYPRALVRKVREVQELARSKGLTLYAKPDLDIPCAIRFLEDRKSVV